MRFETYELDVTESFMTFEFISEGPKGSIKKRVQYQQVGRNAYNLAFGDVNIETDDLDDKVISDNKDTRKVLATVAKTVYTFIDTYPSAEIYIEGSTNSRTRLYQIGISNNLNEINEKFVVLGYSDDEDWSIFEKNKRYSAFLIQLKNN